MPRGHGKAGGGTERDLVAYYPALLAFFRVRLSPRLRADGEDLAQETLLAALRRQAEGGEPIRDVAAFLHGIGIHKLKDHLRKDRRDRRRQAALRREQDRLEQRVAEAAAVTRLKEAHRQQTLREALKRLDEDEREILRLRCGIEELTNAQAARRMGMPPADASRLFYRAREKLYKLFGDDTKEPR